MKRAKSHAMSHAKSRHNHTRGRFSHCNRQGMTAVMEDRDVERFAMKIAGAPCSAPWSTPCSTA